MYSLSSPDPTSVLEFMPWRCFGLGSLSYSHLSGSLVGNMGIYYVGVV